MSAQLGQHVTDFVDGRPEVFLNAMELVFLVLAAVVGLGFACTVVRFARVRKLERAAERR